MVEENAYFQSHAESASFYFGLFQRIFLIFYSKVTKHVIENNTLRFYKLLE